MAVHEPSCHIHLFPAPETDLAEHLVARRIVLALPGNVIVPSRYTQTDRLVGLRLPYSTWQENPLRHRTSNCQMDYAICNETFQGWDWSSTCHRVADLGFGGIEVAPFTLGPDVRNIGPHARHVYAATARRCGLQVVGLHWLLVSPTGLSLTSDDTAVRRETSVYVVALTDFCAALGGKIMVLGSPAQRRVPDGVTEYVALNRLISVLEPAIRRCEQLEITLCIEPLPSPEANLILTLEEAVGVLKQIDSPVVKTIFDVKSASAESKPLPALFREYAEHIAHVHANDANRRGPGSGSTDFAPLLETMKDLKYAGFVSIEVFDYTPDPETIAKEGLAYLKRSSGSES